MNLRDALCGGATITVLLALPITPAGAQGHGPIYGLSTPTLGRGGWSLDVGLMGRWFAGAHTAMARPIVSYGVTADVQISFSAPIPLASDARVPPVRGLTRMPATSDVELMLGWRVHRTGLGVGSRRETTVWLALDEPARLDESHARRHRSVFGAAVTGYASRSTYLWTGAGYGRTLPGRAAADADETVMMGSVVLGYRPGRFRGDYPGPDWRAFIEVVGERRSGGDGPGDVGGNPRGQVVVALTALGLYGSWGVAAGPAFPVYRRLPEGAPAEKVRVAVNGILWF